MQQRAREAMGKCQVTSDERALEAEREREREQNEVSGEEEEPSTGRVSI
jgi:hypothetical protein